MSKTTLDLDHDTGLMVIRPVFECSIAPGQHSVNGVIGEHMFEIFQRWLATNYPNLPVERVQQTSMVCWEAQIADGSIVTFRVII